MAWEEHHVVFVSGLFIFTEFFLFVINDDVALVSYKIFEEMHQCTC
jgi:hypothetical protein